jgi:hypothetical protein
MGLVAYTVTASFTGADLVGRYVSWLSAGHVQAVCQGGAVSAQVVVLDPSSGEPPTVQVRYLFPGREALAAYLTDHAPRLRAEGMALFGPGTGVTFSRSTGDVAHTEPKQ